ncbi:helix-turn-helix transcriptional regulator [Facklamia sp. P13069]|uniref:helix-turn-helix transcriptional regulator n=1 Tax=Facklamia sp. P13069 TaxID=3421954 RepID=UPI003D1775E7
MKRKIGYKIREIRKSLGSKVSMEKFGQLLRPPASRGLVSNWENDYNYPNEERLKQIAELGNTTVENILYGQYTYQDPFVNNPSKPYYIKASKPLSNLNFEYSESSLNKSFDCIYHLVVLISDNTYRIDIYFDVDLSITVSNRKVVSEVVITDKDKYLKHVISKLYPENQNEIMDKITDSIIGFMRKHLKLDLSSYIDDFAENESFDFRNFYTI